MIVLGVVIVACIVGNAIFLLIAPVSGGGPAADQTQAFLQALKDGNYSGAYELFSDETKKELGDPDGFEKWVERNSLQIKSWTPPMSRELDDGTIGMVVTANLANGEQEPLIIVLVESKDEWKIDYFGRVPE